MSVTSPVPSALPPVSVSVSTESDTVTTDVSPLSTEIANESPSGSLNTPETSTTTARPGPGNLRSASVSAATGGRFGITTFTLELAVSPSGSLAVTVTSASP